VPGLLLAEIFLTLWLGAFATPELALSFRLLLAAFAIVAFAVPISNVLVGSGKSGMSARYSWLTVVVVFGSMAIAVPRYGLVGAAGAMLLGCSTSLLFAASARRALQIRPALRRVRFFVGLGAGCASQVVLVAAFDARVSGWLAFVALGMATWASFYLVRASLGALSPEEMQFLRRSSEATRRWSRRLLGRNASR
jgi:O-antigen/teichoic acid export membrane protein